MLAWGNSRDGADGCAVQYQLQNVLPIQASYETYATILGDGSFTALGIGRFSGGSSAVQDQLRDAQPFQAHAWHLQQIRGDGSVITWGRARFGDARNPGLAQDVQPL